MPTFAVCRCRAGSDRTRQTRASPYNSAVQILGFCSKALEFPVSICGFEVRLKICTGKFVDVGRVHRPTRLEICDTDGIVLHIQAARFDLGSQLEFAVYWCCAGIDALQIKRSPHQFAHQRFRLEIALKLPIAVGNRRDVRGFETLPLNLSIQSCCLQIDIKFCGASDDCPRS